MGLRETLLLLSITVLLFSVGYRRSSPMALSQVCRESNEVVHEFLNLESAGDEELTSTQKQVIKTLDIFKDALTRYKFDEIAISYNGGKDCLVMLVLYLSAIYDYYDYQELGSLKQINTVYINYEEQFPELLEFMKYSHDRYNLKILEYKSSLKQGFSNYLSQNPSTKAIIVGARRSDPYSSDLQYFQRTDHNWPDFIRIHPVIDWHYNEIWCFLKRTKVPYCKLYDKGFTSLGGVQSTMRNPNLKVDNDEYLPAYKLKGDQMERDGRRGK